MNKNLFGIFIKYPEPGRVKTRLAKGIGNKKAADICRQVVELILKNTMPFNHAYDRIVFYDPAARQKDFAAWLPAEQFVLQQGSDIGAKMENAVRELLDRGAEKVVLTGADIPGLSGRIIESAFQELNRTDTVIGPARDGGYYLIGMKSPHAEIFRNIPWSTPRVLEDTLMRLRRLRLSVTLIERLSDMDTAEDLHHFFDVLSIARFSPIDPD
jgi:hypothetical protein